MKLTLPQTPTMVVMTTAEVYPALASAWSRMGSHPALTWHSKDGERVELSAKVLDNWVIKTSNLLSEECSLYPGGSLGIHAPVHWRSIIIALATWQRGATLIPLDSGPIIPEHEFDVVASNQIMNLPSHYLNNSEVIALHCESMARKYPDPLPPFVIDANAATMTYSDQLLEPIVPDSNSLALRNPDLKFNELLDYSANRYRDCANESCLVTGNDLSLNEVLWAGLSSWQGGHSIVILDPKIDWDNDQISRIHESEKARVVIVNS